MYVLLNKKFIKFPSRKKGLKKPNVANPKRKATYVIELFYGIFGRKLFQLA